MGSKTKVLIVGLDGVPLSLIEAWATEGKLPTLRKLMEEGTVGELRSTIPPTSGPSWSTFMTGKNPGKTGIYDFLYRREGTYVFPPVNASQRDGIALWRLLSNRGRKVGVVNVPISYPVEEVNGYMISGWMTPYSAQDFCYPADLWRELKDQIGYYTIYPTETFAESRRDSFFRACDELLDLRSRTVSYLMDRYPTDLFMVVLFDTDRVLHQLWHYLDPGHPWRQPGDGTDKSGPVVRYFQRVDEKLAEIVARADEDTVIIILSDHGMGPAHNFIVLNNWLLEVGLLQLKRDPFRLLKRWLFDAGFTLRNVHRIADRIGLAKHAEYKGLYSMDYLMKLVFLSFLDVDWSRSKAYSFGRHLGSIYLNVRGREPEGIVEPGREYEEVREEIMRLARGFVHPRTGEPLIGEILKREDIYQGPYLDRAPDLILRPRDERNIFFGLADFGSNITVDTVYRYSGMHRDYGLLIMTGKGVKKGAAIEGAGIEDLAPTVLYAMECPVPQDMDGRVLSEVFTEEFRNQVTLLQSEEGSSRELHEAVYTEEAEEEIKERLRGLGYLG
ncbi:MAG TPA: alkaline phosphatase family protein [Anaerolineae bacterium]|nr:alkaline phosphatase family protein [Anaerolineae bacterium]